MELNLSILLGSAIDQVSTQLFQTKERQISRICSFAQIYQINKVYARKEK